MKHLFKLIYIQLFIFAFCKTGFSLPINQFINSTAPQMNAVSVNKSFDIVITFTQDMNSATINNANIKVFGYQTGLLSASVIYNAVLKTATINPINDFKIGEIISVTLTSGLKTLANENIIPFVYTFRIQALGGTGIFTRASGINASGNIIRSGDVDSDGDIDLLLDNRIYKNNGNGFFSFHTMLNISGTPELADFDSDGDLDILMGLNNIIYFFQNNGNGDFIQMTSFTGGIGTIGDLNGDGYFDMAYFFNSEDIYILKNSQGAFIIDTTYHFTINCNCTQIYNDRRILIDDLDNDGDLDLVGINGWGGGSSITFYYLHRNFYKLTNNGSNRFIPQLIFTHFIDNAPPFIFGGQDSKSCDINNDGYVDILSPGLCLKNNSNGSYSNIFNFISFNNSIEADFNGDNNIDLVSTMYSTPLITYMNNGTENFTQYVSTSNSFSPGSASSDFDNDGDIDIAIVDDNAQDVSILLNGDNPLPAELSSFTSSVNSNTVSLNWTTTSEENNSGFEIERKTNNEQWSKINFIEGAGNSNTPKYYSYNDRNLSSGKYKYRLKQIDFNGNYKYYELHNEISIGIPGKFELSQNYPNPFNPSTKINYSIPADGIVSLKIYDVNGKEVQTIVNEFKNAGYYSAEFNGIKLASGVYYYRMEVFNTPPAPSQEGSFVQTKKMLLLK